MRGQNKIPVASEPPIAWRGKVYALAVDGRYFTETQRYGRTMRTYFLRLPCCICGSLTFVAHGNHSRQGRGVCGRLCQNQLMSGTNNPRWKGPHKNKRGNRGGHILEYAPGHPAAKKNFVPQHRLVMERALGRPLREDEVIHHIDCDPRNNEEANLIAATVRQHFLSHGSLNTCVAVLLRRGHLLFNRETMRYEVPPQ